MRSVIHGLILHAKIELIMLTARRYSPGEMTQREYSKNEEIPSQQHVYVFFGKYLKIIMN